MPSASFDTPSGQSDGDLNAPTTASTIPQVGECLPWNQGCTFTYTLQNHNAVLGLREFALSAGALVRVVDVDTFSKTKSSLSSGGPEQRSSFHSTMRRIGPESDSTDEVAFDILAFPSECNFSGQRFDVGSVIKAAGEAESQWGSRDTQERHPGAELGDVNVAGTSEAASDEAASRLHVPSCGRRRLILLDAAKGCATAPPDLMKNPVDFVALSYYKIFG